MSGIVRSQRDCCVVGCFNREAKNPELKFYCFPGKSYERERKIRWITAVKRTTREGKPWMPGPDSRVCSAHFVGGTKSENMHDEAYIPTIFPKIYKKKLPNLDRGERLKKRNTAKKIASEASAANEQLELEVDNFVEATQILTQVEMIHIGIQPEPWVEDRETSTSVFFCWTGENDASTQTNIALQNPTKYRKIIVDKPIIATKNKRCGPDVEFPSAFAGFVDINTDTSMRQLAGVSLKFFSVLLDLMHCGEDGQPDFYRKLDKENRLLLFLMKLKLGISFCALGNILSVHSTTAARIFFQVLKTLTAQTKSWIFWPSKDSVKKNLPKSFYKYPNCRCIIDCTEMPTDTPPTVEQRVLMYSNYKGRFAAKFLIAITPDGFICKVSKAYGGRSTDSFITNDSGFLNSLEPGDLVLADKGFPQIHSELNNRNATLVIPPFAFNPQFTDEEVEEGYSIASVRIHVERAIQRVKISQILNHIQIELLPYIDAIMHNMCCIIANSQPPLLKE